MKEKLFLFLFFSLEVGVALCANRFEEVFCYDSGVCDLVSVFVIQYDGYIVRPVCDL